MYEGSKTIIPCCFNPLDCFNEGSATVATSITPTLSSSSSSASSSPFTKQQRLKDRIVSSDKSNKINSPNSQRSYNNGINDTIILNGPENHDEVALVFWFKGLSGSPLFTLDFSSRGSLLTSGYNYKIQSHLKSTSTESTRISIENTSPSYFHPRNKNDIHKRGRADTSKWIIPSLAINPVTLEDDSDYRYVHTLRPCIV